MSKEFFILKQRRKVTGYNPAQLSIELWETLNQLSEATNIPMRVILEQAVDFALEYLVIEERGAE